MGVEGLGVHFGSNLYEAEVRYLVENEWAMTPEDVLTRRTKEGLRLSEEQKTFFSDWFQEQFNIAQPQAHSNIL